MCVAGRPCTHHWVGKAVEARVKVCLHRQHTATPAAGYASAGVRRVVGEGRLYFREAAGCRHADGRVYVAVGSSESRLHGDGYL